MSNHTKGPYIAQGHIVRQYVGENVGGRVIADCGPHHTPLSEYPKSCLAEDEANAKRIADALNAYEANDPVKRELLEALETLAAYPVARGYPDGPCIKAEDMEEIRAAIAKAKEAQP